MQEEAIGRWGRVAFPLGLKAVQHVLQQLRSRAVLSSCE